MLLKSIQNKSSEDLVPVGNYTLNAHKLNLSQTIKQQAKQHNVRKKDVADMSAFTIFILRRECPKHVPASFVELA